MASSGNGSGPVREAFAGGLITDGGLGRRDILDGVLVVFDRLVWGVVRVVEEGRNTVGGEGGFYGIWRRSSVVSRSGACRAEQSVGSCISKFPVWVCAVCHLRSVNTDTDLLTLGKGTGIGDEHTCPCLCLCARTAWTVTCDVLTQKRREEKRRGEDSRFYVW